MTLFNRRQLVMTCALLMAGGAALAQQPARVAGTFATLSDTGGTLQGESGAAVPFTFAANLNVATLSKATVADLKPGAFVGVGARPQKDGSQKAVQIVIFPESMRGTGEGHRAWGVMPEATMTNGAIAETVQSVDGPNFTLNYKDGAQKVTTPADASILLLALADRTALKQGARGQIIGQQQSDGSISVTRITIWKDGVTPY